MELRHALLAPATPVNRFKAGFARIRSTATTGNAADIPGTANTEGTLAAVDTNRTPSHAVLNAHGLFALHTTYQAVVAEQKLPLSPPIPTGFALLRGVVFAVICQAQDRFSIHQNGLQPLGFFQEPVLLVACQMKAQRDVPQSRNG